MKAVELEERNITIDVPTETTVSVVLLYHRIGYPKLSSLVAGQYVAASLFRSEIDYLLHRGWHPISLEAAAETCESGSTETNNYTVTFDDGYLSVYEHAVPILIERKVPATVFVVADSIGGINEWDRLAGDRAEPIMSADQMRELADNGIEIGSHTLTHAHLNRLSPDEAKREIVDSKHKIEDIIGREVAAFSYPYGEYSRASIDAANEAGYKYAVNTKLGVVTLGCSRYEIPRVNVRWNATGPLLARKIKRAKKASGLRS